MIARAPVAWRRQNPLRRAPPPSTENKGGASLQYDRRQAPRLCPLRPASRSYTVHSWYRFWSGDEGEVGDPFHRAEVAEEDCDGFRRVLSALVEHALHRLRPHLRVITGNLVQLPAASTLGVASRPSEPTEVSKSAEGSTGRITAGLVPGETARAAGIVGLVVRDLVGVDKAGREGAWRRRKGGSH